MNLMKSLRLVAIIAATLMLIYSGIMFPQSFAQSASNGTPSQTTDQGTPSQTTDQGTPSLGALIDQSAIDSTGGGPSCNAGGTLTTGYFLSMDGIAGESGDQKHKCAIDIMSFSWGASNTGTHSVGGGGGAGAGKVRFQDVHFTKRVDSSSPILMLDTATGKHIKTAVLSFRKAGGEQQSQDFLTITFTNVLVSEYQMGGTASSDPVPTDEFSLNFAKISVQYRPTMGDGSLGAPITSCFDVQHRVKC
jgi:type VI secretion system secreted protein Hcp